MSARQSNRRQPRPVRRSQPLQITQPAGPQPQWSEINRSFTIPGTAILPLRLFLGLTFLYAGIQKLSDPGFLTIGAPTYIGTQLRGFSQGSPLSFVMVHFLEHAVIIGMLTILVELVVGACVLLGLFTRLAALVGLGLNLTFFLTATWHVYPYFLGSDIVFVIAWLTLAVTGPGAFCLDAAIREPLRARFDASVQRLVTGPMEGGVAETPAQTSWLTRGEILLAGAGAALFVVLGVMPKGRTSVAAKVAGGPSTKSSSTASSSTGSATGSGSSSSASAPPAGTTKVGATSQIPVNSALATTDPKSGDPAVVVHLPGSSFVAYDAVCTHAGCTVEYDPQYKLLVCPCHGGAYDPAHGAQVVAGPPPTPLQQLPITIDKAGNIYLA
jgi:thiosulfate dehydrogenase [quinone] large subunit